MNALKGIGKVASTVLVGCAVVLALALVGVRLVGFEVYTVLSGSMEPAYKTGSVIWVDRCEPEDVEVGDAITFVLNEDLDVATHRVIEVDAENSHFYTQGDANDAPDGSPVHFENLIGVPVFTVPHLGYLVSYVQSPPGCYVALIVAAAALALMFIPDLFDRAEAKKRQSAEAERAQMEAARSRRAQRAGAPGSHDPRRASRPAAAQASGRSPQKAPMNQNLPMAKGVQARPQQPRRAQEPTNSRPTRQARTVGAQAANQANNPRLRAQSAQVAVGNSRTSSRVERREKA